MTKADPCSSISGCRSWARGYDKWLRSVCESRRKERRSSRSVTTTAVRFAAGPGILPPVPDVQDLPPVVCPPGRDSRGHQGKLVGGGVAYEYDRSNRGYADPDPERRHGEPRNGGYAVVPPQGSHREGAGGRGVCAAVPARRGGRPGAGYAADPPEVRSEQPAGDQRAEADQPAGAAGVPRLPRHPAGAQGAGDQHPVHPQGYRRGPRGGQGQGRRRVAVYGQLEVCRVACREIADSRARSREGCLRWPGSAGRGPQGKLSHQIPPGIEVEVDGDSLHVRRTNETKAVKSLHGLTRKLLANMVEGVNEGFKKVLEINGVGYRAELKDRELHMTLGFSIPSSSRCRRACPPRWNGRP